MPFVANYWWLWLILSSATFIYGGFNQIRRMQRMMDGRQNSLSRGLFALFIAAVLNFAFTVLLIVSIVLNFIDYANRQGGF